MSFRSGFCCFVGRPNAGKSTLTNALVGSKIVITSDKPQTTRHAVRGIRTRPDNQLVIVDTPGLHRPRTLLGERLNDVVRATLAEVDVIGFCLPAGERIGPGDRFIAAELAGATAPVLAVVTKTDAVPKHRVAEQLQAVSQLGEFAEIVPVSARTGAQVDLLADLMSQHLPEGPLLYPDDVTTDNDTDTRIAELVREAALTGVRDELPHSIAVTVDEQVRRDTGLLEIFATLHLERDSQKGIVIGPAGRGSLASAAMRAPASRPCSARRCISRCTSPSSANGSATPRSSTGWASDRARPLPRRVPGGAGLTAFAAAAFVMRMPIAMYPVGIVLIISARDGHYGFAGVLSACYVVGGVVGMPLTAVVIDRLGQRRVLVPAALAHAASAATLAIMVRAGASHAALTVPAVLVGATYLSVGSLSRARWSHALDGRPELATAMSLESVLDEVIFVLGPVVATVIATHAVPVLVLYLTLALVLGGSVWLTTLRATEPPVHADAERHPFALRSPGMPLLAVATIPMGAVFACLEVSGIAFCGQHHHRGVSGIVIAAIAAGSGAAGLVYGAREHAAPVLDRFRVQAVIFALLPLLLFTVVNVPLLLIVNFLVGLGIAPALITAFELVQQLVPARALTEGLTWINTGLGVGYGAGAAVIGAIADAHGARTAFLLVVGSGLAVGVLGLLLHAQAAARASDPAAEPVAACRDPQQANVGQG